MENEEDSQSNHGEDNQNISKNLRKRTAEEVASPSNSPSAPKVAKFSQTSDVRSIFCAICLQTTVPTRTLGKPDCCDHKFCSLCICHWSETKNKAVCPIDGKEYSKIHHINPSTGKDNGRVTVPKACEFEINGKVYRCFDRKCRVCALDVEDSEDLDGECARCRRLVHQTCLGATLNCSTEDWLCQECKVRRGTLEVLVAAGMAPGLDLDGFVRGEEFPPGSEDDLTTDLKEDVEAYLGLVRKYLRDANGRFTFQRHLEWLKGRLNTADKNEEEDESKWALWEEQTEDFPFYDGHTLDLMDSSMGMIEEQTDRLLAELEGNDSALDDYIDIAKKALKRLEATDAVLRDQSVEWGEEIDHLMTILKIYEPEEVEEESDSDSDDDQQTGWVW